MKISELIAKLQEVQAEHGDLEAVAFTQGLEAAPSLKVLEPEWRESYEPWVSGISKVLTL